MQNRLEKIGRQFEIGGRFLEGMPWGNGHINDTYAVTYTEGSRHKRYIHQRINEDVFRDPVALMNNIERVCNHLRKKLRIGSEESTREALTVVPTRSGAPFLRDGDGNYWRTYIFIESARTFDTPQSEKQAFEVARAFGRFQRLLADFPAPQLQITIPDFHNTPVRLKTLQNAISEDPCGRAGSVKAEIDFVLRRQSIVARLTELAARSEIPMRTTHNDTKINNVMIDEGSGRGICVIDLDTVMPGLSLYDFGDLVRSSASKAAEDERDLSKVDLDLGMFEQLVRGYLLETKPMLNPLEIEHMAFAGQLITFETGMRFLTDFLEGDNYFQIQREGQNLDRARVQFRRLECMENRNNALYKIVREHIA